MDTLGLAQSVVGMVANLPGSTCRVWFFRVRGAGKESFEYWAQTSEDPASANAMAI